MIATTGHELLNDYLCGDDSAHDPLMDRVSPKLSRVLEGLDDDAMGRIVNETWDTLLQNPNLTEPFDTVEDAWAAMGFALRLMEV